MRTNTQEEVLLEIIVDNEKGLLKIGEYKTAIEELRAKQALYREEVDKGRMSKDAYKRSLTETTIQIKNYQDNVRILSKEIQNNIKRETAVAETLTVEREEGDPQVGDTASPDGEHLMPDGSTIIVAVGVISEIVEAQQESDPSQELATAQAQLATANARIVELESKLPKDEEQKILSAIKAMGGAKTLATICSAYKPEARESTHAKQAPRWDSTPV